MKIVNLLPQMRTVAEKVDGKQRDQIGQRNDSICIVLAKVFPVSEMFFRPEEEHRASGVARVFHPFHEWDRDVPDDAVGIGLKDFTVSDLDTYGLSAIKTRGIDLDCLPRE